MKRKEFFKITSSVLSSALILTGTTQLGKIDIHAKENIEVETSKDVQISIEERGESALVNLYAVKDIENIDVKITIDGKKVIVYHIDILKAGESSARMITKEQLEKVKKSSNNRIKTLPNTAVVRKNIEKSLVLDKSELKVLVSYDVNDELKKVNKNSLYEVERKGTLIPSVPPKEEVPTLEQPIVPKEEAPTPEQPTEPKGEMPAPEQPTTPKEEAPTLERPTTPKEEAPTSEQPTEPKEEMPAPEQPTTPKEEAPTLEQPTTPKEETPTTEQPTTPKEEAPTLERPTTPKEEAPTTEQPTAPKEEVDSEEIVINDVALKKLINKNIALERADNQKITKKEIESLTEIKLRDENNRAILESTSLRGTPEFKFIQTRGIKDISGLENAVNLEYLELGENEISDLTPLANLTSLKHLSLFRNRIENVEPLANLTSLEYLDLYSNKLTNISALKNLVNLKHLDLHNNNDQIGDERKPTISGGISDISVVANMPKLEVLSLGSNNISDISALVGLNNISELVLGGNHISDYSSVLEYITPKIVNMVTEVGGSISFAGQSIKSSGETEVTSNRVSFSSPFKGLDELGKKLAESLESDEAINFFSEVETNVDGISVVYNTETSSFDFSFTDEFLKNNNEKVVPVNLVAKFDSYAWRLNDIQLKINIREDVDKDKTNQRVEYNTVVAKVLDNDKKLVGSRLRLFEYDRFGIPNILDHKSGVTDEHGLFTVGDLKPNTEYELRNENRDYSFARESVSFTTDAKGNLKTLDGKDISEVESNIVEFKTYGDTENTVKTVRTEFKVVDEDGNPVGNVELSVNGIRTKITTLKNARSNSEGIVYFELENKVNDVDYIVNVSKNDQFNWEFKPDAVALSVKKDGSILYTDQYKGEDKRYEIEEYNGHGIPVFVVKKVDKNYLKDELKNKINEAEALLENLENSDLSNIVASAKAELAKEETLPIYVEGFVKQLSEAMANLKGGKLEAEQPTAPKEEAPEPEQPTTPKEEAPTAEQPTAPKEEAPAPEESTAPKEEESTAEQPTAPKEEAPIAEESTESKEEVPLSEQPVAPKDEEPTTPKEDSTGTNSGEDTAIREKAVVSTFVITSERDLVLENLTFEFVNQKNPNEIIEATSENSMLSNVEFYKDEVYKVRVKENNNYTFSEILIRVVEDDEVVLNDSEEPAIELVLDKKKERVNVELPLLSRKGKPILETVTVQLINKNNPKDIVEKTVQFGILKEFNLYPNTEYIVKVKELGYTFSDTITIYREDDEYIPYFTQSDELVEILNIEK